MKCISAEMYRIVMVVIFYIKNEIDLQKDIKKASPV